MVFLRAGPRPGFVGGVVPSFLGTELTLSKGKFWREESSSCRVEDNTGPLTLKIHTCIFM